MVLIILVMSVITFGVFGYDKQAAIQGRWRIPEKTLFALSILGGAAGGLLGMSVFHHKTRKTQFWIILGAALLLHLFLLTRTNVSFFGQ